MDWDGIKLAASNISLITCSFLDESKVALVSRKETTTGFFRFLVEWTIISVNRREHNSWRLPSHMYWVGQAASSYWVLCRDMTYEPMALARSRHVEIHLHEFARFLGLLFPLCNTMAHAELISSVVAKLTFQMRRFRRFWKWEIPGLPTDR